jgi:hypothetical protein
MTMMMHWKNLEADFRSLSKAMPRGTEKNHDKSHAVSIGI